MSVRVDEILKDISQFDTIQLHGIQVSSKFQ